MSNINCNIHIYNQVKEKQHIYYCDYCGKGSFTRYNSNSFPISIQYFKTNIVFQLNFHQTCFELFYNVNHLKFCKLCSNYYSEELV